MTRRARFAGAASVALVLAASGAFAQGAGPWKPPPGQPGAAAAPAAAPTSVPIQLELKGPVAIEMPASKGWPPWIGTLIGSIASGLIGLGGVALGLRLNRNTAMATIHQKANEAELAKIEALLGAFHLPYRQVAEENRLFYDEFAVTLQVRHPSLTNFSLLLSLLQPDWLASLTANDQTLIKQIVDNGATMQALIREKSGGVSLVLMDFLVRAAVHYSTLNLAYARALKGDPARLSAFVYPAALDAAIEADVVRLRARAELLRGSPDKAHKPMDELVIGAKLPAWTARQPRTGVPQAAPVETPTKAKPKVEADKAAPAAKPPAKTAKAKAPADKVAAEPMPPAKAGKAAQVPARSRQRKTTSKA